MSTMKQIFLNVRFRTNQKKTGQCHFELFFPANGQLFPGFAGPLHNRRLVQQQPWLSDGTGCPTSLYHFSQSHSSLHPVRGVSSPSLPQEGLIGTGKEVRSVPWWWSMVSTIFHLKGKFLLQLCIHILVHQLCLKENITS